MTKDIMRIAICDDETRITDEIRRLLQEYFKGECVIDVFNEGKKFLRNNEKYDVVFCDISIGDINGIELVKRIRKKDTQVFIIFVTNYGEYSQYAFSVHAYEYVIKPIYKERMFAILDDIKLYKNDDKQEEYICLKSKDGIVQIKVGEIIYFEYVSRKVKMVLEDKSLLLMCSLNEIIGLLSPYGFAVPHRAFVINLRKIVSVKKYDIIMNNGDILPLAQKKAAGFKKLFEIYLYEQTRDKEK